MSPLSALTPRKDHRLNGPKLPMDVIYEVIIQLVRPSHKDCFTFDSRRVTATIASLCRVSKDLNFWSKGYLYTFIAIQRTRSLTLILSPARMHTGIPIRVLVLGHPLIETRIQGIVQLLEAVASTLERVMFLNQPAEKMNTILNTHPVSLPSLNDVVYVQSRNNVRRVSPALSHLWPNVRRLALIGIYIDLQDRFPNVEVLVLNTYKATLAKAMHIVACHARIRSITIITPNKLDLQTMVEQPSQSVSQVLPGPSKGNVANAYRDQVSFIDVHRKGSSAATVYDWAIERALRGDVWTLEGTDWLSYYRDVSHVDG